MLNIWGIVKYIYWLLVVHPQNCYVMKALSPRSKVHFFFSAMPMLIIVNVNWQSSTWDCSIYVEHMLVFTISKRFLSFPSDSKTSVHTAVWKAIFSTIFLSFDFSFYFIAYPVLIIYFHSINMNVHWLPSMSHAFRWYCLGASYETHTVDTENTPKNGSYKGSVLKSHANWQEHGDNKEVNN